MQDFNPEDFNAEELMVEYADFMNQAAAIQGETLFATGIFALMGIMLLFVLIPLFIVSYVLLSIGLFVMARKRSIDNAWIAFIPFGQFYVLGKLVAPLKLGKNEVPKLEIVLPVAVLASFILNFIPVIGQLIALAVFVLVLFALYRLYEMYSDNALVYTIFSVVGLSPVFVFILRNKKLKSEEDKEDEIDKNKEQEKVEETEEVEKIEELEEFEEGEETEEESFGDEGEDEEEKREE